VIKDSEFIHNCDKRFGITTDDSVSIALSAAILTESGVDFFTAMTEFIPSSTPFDCEVAPK
jgi:hypothetical protein